MHDGVLIYRCLLTPSSDFSSLPFLRYAFSSPLFRLFTLPLPCSFLPFTSSPSFRLRILTVSPSCFLFTPTMHPHVLCCAADCAGGPDPDQWLRGRTHTSGGRLFRGHCLHRVYFRVHRPAQGRGCVSPGACRLPLVGLVVWLCVCVACSSSSLGRFKACCGYACVAGCWSNPEC